MKILVLGDECTDVFVCGETKRLSPEAPVPVLTPIETLRNPGMAGNVEANLRAMGYDPIKITNMTRVHPRFAEASPYTNTAIVKTRYIDRSTGYILLRVDENDMVTQPGSKELVKKNLVRDISSFDLVIVADYNKGFLTEDLMKWVFKKSKCSFLDTKREIGTWAEDVTYIKINDKEFNNFSHKKFLSSEQMANKVIVTEGGSGCRIQNEHRYVNRVEVRDVSGAGDTFMAAVATKFIECDNIWTAMEWGNKCARQVVQQRGVTTIQCLT